MERRQALTLNLLLTILIGFLGWLGVQVTNLKERTAGLEAKVNILVERQAYAAAPPFKAGRR